MLLQIKMVPKKIKWIYLQTFNIWRGSHINLGGFSCRSSVVVKLECGYVGFRGGRKTGEPWGKPLELGKNQQQTKPAYATRLELNSGLIEERQMLSPLHHPCSPEERERRDCNLICLLWVTTLYLLSRDMKRVSSHLLMQKIVIVLDWSALYGPYWLLTPLHVFLTLCLTSCVKVWWELVRRLCLLDSIC